ncbi:MAG: hypothetical protein OXF74_05460 [Rhodobacteraceae bacterium]|nr:hypothetical protein [Paracoccaceae bacterium]
MRRSVTCLAAASLVLILTGCGAAESPETPPAPQVSAESYAARMARIDGALRAAMDEFRCRMLERRYPEAHAAGRLVCAVPGD